MDIFYGFYDITRRASQFKIVQFLSLTSIVFNLLVLNGCSKSFLARDLETSSASSISGGDSVSSSTSTSTSTTSSITEDPSAPVIPPLVNVPLTTANLALAAYGLSSLKAGKIVSVRALYQANVAGTYTIDLEMRTTANVTLAQKQSASQTFAAGESREFDWNFVVPASQASGPYWMVIAAFSPDYSQTFVYNQNTVALAAADPPIPPKPLPPGGAVSGQFKLGLNVSGMDYGGAFIPGVGGTNYALISTGELDLYHSENLNLIRLPVLWERLQPTINGDLNQVYLAQIEAVIDYSASHSMLVILDIHNFGGRNGHQLGDGTLTAGHFADLWTKLATVLKGRAGIAGFDLMNEPNNMPTQTAWAVAAQAAINAIRAIDPNVTLYVEGDSWSSADRWNETNVTFPLKDPSNKVIYSGHAYADSDGSGTHFAWATEAAKGVTTDLLTTRISHFAAWCEAYKVPCHIGEFGVGNDDPAWNVALDKAVAFGKAHGLQMTYWAAGPWWGNYAYSIESPTAPQLNVLKAYARGGASF